MKVAVVGAGWAGLAAALRLADAGVALTLFDAAPVAGGRARSSRLQTPLGSFTTDNGQHLIVGAYRESLSLIAGLDGAAPLRRVPLDLSATNGLRLQAARLPAPLHLGVALLGARGLGPGGRAAAVRLMLSLRLAGWRAADGETVSALLHRLRQPPPLTDRLWAPLCIGALNTLPDQACATAFATVLRDTLGGPRSASDFVLVDAPLGALLPEPALARLRRAGAAVRLRCPVRRLERADAQWRIGTEVFDELLLALPPWSAAAVLEASGLRCGQLRAFEPEAIATGWALWPVDRAPALPRWCLLDEDPARQAHGQWLFDRGVIQGRSDDGRSSAAAHLAGIVISVAGQLESLPRNALADGLSRQLVQAFGGPPPAAVHVVTERRATFRCTPQRPRLEVGHLRDEGQGPWLAGDWLWPDYPATLEAAVRSGRHAADLMLARRPD